LNKNDNNSSIYQQSKLKKILDKIKLKHKINNRDYFNNKNNILFGDSYYNFIIKLKNKRDSLNKTNSNINKGNNHSLYNNIKEIKSSFAYTIHNIKNNQYEKSNKNNGENMHITSPNKTLDNQNISSKTPNKIKLTINNITSNNFKINSVNRKNEFNLFNINHSKYSKSINDNTLLNKIICPLCHNEIDNYKYKSHFYLHTSQIFNWLYLGSFSNACNIKDLKELKINYILNCAIECKNNNIPVEINYYHALINDSPFFQINFEKTNNFINRAKLSGGNILIHCQLGISRSTTCLIAYMIKYLGYTTLTALQFIKKKRPQEMPNIGFIQQLKNYENKINMSKNDNKPICDDIININNKKEKNFDLFIKNN
jgi:protein-tyrosine phosphatase